MTHGFDDQGRKFDAHGNMSEWWTPEDLKNYEARVEVHRAAVRLVRLRGAARHGKARRWARRRADLGGLSIAYRALSQVPGRGSPEPAKIDGFTGDQRFFLSWARVWAANVRPELSKLLLQHEPAPAAAVPRDRTALVDAGVREGVRLQVGRRDGSRRGVPDLVSLARRRRVMISTVPCHPERERGNPLSSSVPR